MKRFSALSLLLLMFVSLAAAQSGRRVKAAPTPAPLQEDSPAQYSESKPLPKRIIPPSLARETRTEPLKPAANDKVTSADEGDVVKVDSNLVTIPDSVYDRNGVYIPNLRQSDFKIFEDGKDQEIAYFGRTDVPFTVILLLDTSPSTEYKIDQIRDAARAFVEKLGPQDTVMVIEFAWNVHVLCEPTQDRAIINKAIGKADFGEGTSL